MTKDEAIDLAIDTHGCTGSIELIDAIYDSFESRTCSSCKYFAKYVDKDYGDCYGEARKYSSMDDCHEDFGCNKWEQKDK